jgi:hypothetical protein
MTDAEFRRHVRTVAMYFAVLSHEEDHPGADPHLAAAYAEGNWRSFVEMAIDFMACREVAYEEEVMRN